MTEQSKSLMLMLVILAFITTIANIIIGDPNGRSNNNDYRTTRNNFK